MNKSHRLQNIINMENLKDKEFVVLDNNYKHIESFCEMKNVVAIRATTDTYDKSFYQIAIDALSSSYQQAKERRLGEKYQYDWQMISNPAPKKPYIESIEPTEDKEFERFLEELLADENSDVVHDPFIPDIPPSKTIKEQVEDRNKTIGNKTPNTIDNEGTLSSCHPQAYRPLNTDSDKGLTQSFKIQTIRSIKFYKPPQHRQDQGVYGSSKLYL